MTYVDVPISSVEDDYFGFARYRDALLKALRSSDTPLTVGVFGAWGSGKTSLLKLVQEELDRLSGQDYAWLPITVWFNAWQYDRDEALWRALILAVLDGLREEEQPEEEAATELDHIEASLYRTVEWEELGKWTIDWAQALESTARGATRIALSFIPGAAPIASAVEQAWSELRGDTTTSEELDKAVQSIRREVQRYRREQVRSLEQFQRGFARLVRERVVERGRRLVVFIDDLDRCLPEKAIGVLETIKLFLNVEGCFFLLAADHNVIEKGMRVKYQNFLLDRMEAPSEEDIARRIPITGRDYIEKIVQLPFSLPPLERQKVCEFIEKRYSRLADCAQVCATGLEPNPRKVKRMVNLLQLLISLAPGETDQALLTKVVVIQNRYPDLYAQLFDYPNLLKELERYFLQSGDVPSAAEGDRQQQTLYRLRDRYIHHKALADMLRLEPLFKDLSREQLDSYLYLTRATSEDSRIVRAETPETPVWDKLRSGDLTQINDALERIQTAQLTDQYAIQIAAMLEQDDLLPQERLSLGLAWGQLGYPQDLDARVSVPGTSLKLGKYLVTNQQFLRFVEAGGYQEPSYWEDEWAHVPASGHPKYWNEAVWNQPTQPVVGISWYEAWAYCRWLSQQEGKTCRLPREEEWIRAATGVAEPPGDMEQVPAYPWGVKFDPKLANTSESSLGVTTPVGCYPSGASPVGAQDVSGNVWEWMADDGYRFGSKSLRGGTWRYGADKSRLDTREDALPTFRANFVGFRVLCVS